MSGPWWWAKTSRPILVGPWTSEMGFEVLYWVPYLEHILHTWSIPRERLWIVTRGGVHRWYGQGTHAVELYDYVPPKDLRLAALHAQSARKSVKQLDITPWERKLIALIAERHGLRRYHLCHPSRLYQDLDAWWTTQRVGLARATRYLRFTPMQTPPLPVGLALPERYVVVRWYQRTTWPLTEELLAWSQAMVLELATRVPVVILQTGAYFDDHVDFPAPTHPNVTVIQAEPLRDNLGIQSAILARALACVGTWGGMAQLAVRLGVPTAAFYHAWQGASYAHKILTDYLALGAGVPCFVGRPQDAESVRQILPVELPLPAPAGASSSAAQ